MAESYVKPTDKRFIDLEGREFGYATVREFRGQNKHRTSLWLIFCDPKRGGCGAEKVVAGNSLRDGSIKSCGCKKRKDSSSRLRKMNTTHGLTRHPAYCTYDDMIQRCHNPKHRSYYLYGGRTDDPVIYVSEEWRGHPEVFCAWVEMQFPPDGKIPKELSLERRDNNGPYASWNCYFATAGQQGRNKRSNRLVSFNGRTEILAQWAREIGMSDKGLSWRLDNWPVEKALTTLPHKHSENS